MLVSIDPGNPSGSLCYQDKGIYHYIKLPSLFSELHMVLTMLKATECYVEDITYVLNVAQKNKQALIESYYMSVYCAESLGIKVIKLKPKYWQKSIGYIPAKGTSYIKRKKELHTLAKEIDPNVELWACDSLLILSASGLS